MEPDSEITLGLQRSSPAPAPWLFRVEPMMYPSRTLLVPFSEAFSWVSARGRHLADSDGDMLGLEEGVQAFAA